MDNSKIISFKDGKEMYDNYTNNNYQLVNAKRDPNNPDARSFWYSIKDLEDYLNFLRQQMPSMDPNKMGVRIYLGTYGSHNDEKGTDITGYQNIFMYPMEMSEDLFADGTEKSASADLGFNRGCCAPPY